MTTDPSPKIPLWVFVVSDVALIVTAWLIAEYSRHPLSPAAVASVAGCAALGTLVLLVPLVLRYERQKNEVLDERQRSLEGIARTVHESAEQLSIAANGLNQIASLARQSIQTAETLPEKLKAQIGAFEAKATQANDTDRARLEKELSVLRKANADQLAIVAAQIAAATTEWTKLEAASRLQLGQASDALAKLDQEAAAKITAAHAHALTALDTQLKALAERSTAAAVVTPIQITATPVSPTVPAESASPAPVTPTADSAAEASMRIAANVSSPETTAAIPTTEVTPATPPPKPKRPRKPRPESAPVSAESERDVAPPSAAAPESTVAESAPSSAPIATDPALETPAPTTPAPATEPGSDPNSTPVSAEPTPATASTAPVAAVESNPAITNSVAPSAPEPVAIETPTANAAATETPRRRAARAKPQPEPEPMLDLAIDDSAPPLRSIERGLSSDGATRMIVTAYIGIGNRLFIRGEGPGLSLDKGVPLQFVSIGKWRWETNDATAPIRFRILKNDAVECTALGEQTLDPGYQAEFGANF